MNPHNGIFRRIKITLPLKYLCRYGIFLDEFFPVLYGLSDHILRKLGQDDGIGEFYQCRCNKSPHGLSSILIDH